LIQSYFKLISGPDPHSWTRSAAQQQQASSGPDQRASGPDQRSSKPRRSAQQLQIYGPAQNCAADPKKAAQILLYMLGTITAAGPSIGQKKSAISSAFNLV
jgi:hypothetical protein